MRNIQNLAISVFLLLCACANNDLIKNQATIEKYDRNYSITNNNRKLVLVGGCFDVLHFGHIEFLKKAKATGDFLIVALEPDERIAQKQRKPVHNQQERAEIIASLYFVDQVLLLPVLKGFADYNQLVQAIHPSVIAVTDDDPQLTNKQKQASTVGATVEIVTPRLKQFATSLIVRNHNYKDMN
jgi:FAD synthetase